MAVKTYKLTKEAIEKAYGRLLPNSSSESKPQYTYWQLKVSGITYTAYTSGKLVVQGKDISEAERFIDEQDMKIARTNMYPQMGSDEVGCGDYLGPIVVGICYIEDQRTADYLLESGLADTKTLSERKILELDKKIRMVARVSTVVLTPEKYNKWARRNLNMVDIKCQLHRMAWSQMQKKVSLPGLRVIDGFCTEERYKEAVHGQGVQGIQFIPKADSNYVSVMCGAVVARAKFLKEITKLENKWNFILEKGASETANMSAVKFIQENGRDNLEQVAKLNFSNTKKVDKYIEIHNII